MSSNIVIVVAQQEGGLKAACPEGYRIIKCSSRQFSSIELYTDMYFSQKNLEIYDSGWVALAENVNEE